MQDSAGTKKKTTDGLSQTREFRFPSISTFSLNTFQPKNALREVLSRQEKTNNGKTCLWSNLH